MQTQILEVPLSLVVVRDRIRQDYGDIQSLADSIKAHGLMQPIGIDPNYRLVFGERRLKAMESLGAEKIPARIVHVASILEAERDENEVRKDFTPSERVAIGQAIEAAMGERRGGDTSAGAQSNPVNLPECKGAETREIAAEKAGFGSEANYRKAKAVTETGTSELVEAMDTGKASIHAAATIATVEPEQQKEIVAKGEKEILEAAKQIRAEKTAKKRVERIEKITAISQGNEALEDTRRFNVIYADPPWRYQHAESESRAIENQYPTMTLEDICALQVPASDDAVLFMWATSPKLEEALQVVGAWGFTYKTCAVWDKQKIGMGYYFRQQHELLLVCTKGSLPTPEAGKRPGSIFSFPRGEHSAKPLEVADLIVELYPEYERLEMFCRTPRDGWQVWGNQSSA